MPRRKRGSASVQCWLAWHMMAVFSVRFRLCTTIPRSTGRITRQRRRALDTSNGEQRPTAREAADPRHHRLHLLRYVCRKTSAVYSSSITTTSVPVRAQSVPPRHQGNGKAGRSAFRVARRTEGLPILGMVLPSVPPLKNLATHCYSTGRLHTPTCQFSRTLHTLRINLRGGGVMWEPPMETSHIRNIKTTEIQFNSLLLICRVNNYKAKCSTMYTRTGNNHVVRARTIPTERPPLAGEVSANFCG
jgi:hypothetical protein